MKAVGFGRREFLGTVAAGTGMAAPMWSPRPATGAALAQSATSPVEPGWQALHLENGRHLFVDDYLVGAAQHVAATLHHPQKTGDPLLAGVGTANDNFQPFLTVLHDEKRGRFRMWYNTRKVMRNGRTMVSYTESADGVHWETPYRELFEIFGFGDCVTDSGDQEPDPERRYKIIYWGRAGTGPLCGDGGAALRAAFSPDGIKWTQYRGNPVTPDLWRHSPQCDPAKRGDSKWREYAADCVHTVWDPVRQVHVAYVKAWTWPPREFGYISPTATELGGQRLECVMTSPDFIHWSTPVRCFVPEPDDVPSIEFGYAFRPKPRGNQLLVLSCILDQGISTEKGNGIGYTVLSTTTDFVHCNRMREPWLDRAAGDPDAPDHAIAWVGDMITVGEEEYIYYGSYQWGHKNFTDRTISLARLRKDGFVSRDAGRDGGKLVTRLFRSRAEQLTVNANVRGELRLRILGQDGQAVEGFREGEVRPLKGDSTAHPIRAKADVSGLKGRPVQIEFSMRDAELYGFELA